MKIEKIKEFNADILLCGEEIYMDVMSHPATVPTLKGSALFIGKEVKRNPTLKPREVRPLFKP